MFNDVAILALRPATEFLRYLHKTQTTTTHKQMRILGNKPTETINVHITNLVFTIMMMAKMNYHARGQNELLLILT